MGREKEVIKVDKKTASIWKKNFYRGCVGELAEYLGVTQRTVHSALIKGNVTPVNKELITNFLIENKVIFDRTQPKKVDIKTFNKWSNVKYWGMSKDISTALNIRQDIVSKALKQGYASELLTEQINEFIKNI